MSTNRWAPNAAAVAQVVTITVTGYDVTTTYKVTINGKVVSVLGSGGTTATTATALQVALAASIFPEFLEVAWTVVGSVITGTANTAGKPFTATSSATGGAGTIGAVTTTVTSSGPNDWSIAANWSLGAVPVSTDDVWIENSSVDILYGLAQSGVTLTSLNIAATFTGRLGLPKYTGQYYEYRGDYLAISATTINVGYGPGQGSGRIKVNAGTVQATVNVYGTAGTAEAGVESFLFLGTHAANTVNVAKGSVGIAVFAGEAATVATLQISFVSQVQGDATVHCGPGATLTTVSKTGGDLQLQTNVTTLTQTAGTCTVKWTAAVTTLTVDGGTVTYSSTGTLGTGNVGNKGTLDFSQDMRAVTVTNCNLYAGGTLKDPGKRVTWTNPIALVRCSIPQVVVDLGTGINLQRS